MKALLREEAGGVALIMVLAFMALGVPVITSTLKLADVVATDSRVKTDALKRNYCGLGTKEYVSYLTLDPVRWSTWWADNQDPALPVGEAAVETATICGESITVRATLRPPTDDILTEPPETVGVVPPLSSLSKHKIQTLKTVQPATVSAGDLVTYTITILSRDTDDIDEITSIEDEMPPAFATSPALPPPRSPQVPPLPQSPSGNRI